MKIKETKISRIYNGAQPVIVKKETWSADRKVYNLIEFEINGTVTHESKTEFDDKGRAIYMESRFPFENISSMIKAEFRDDEALKIERQFYQDGSNNKTVTFYDRSNGNINWIKKYEDEDSDDPFETITFTYNNAGKVIKEETSNDGAVGHDIKTWSYNEKNNLISYESKIIDNIVNTEFEYDDHDRLKRQLSFNNGKPQEDISFEYKDSQGAAVADANARIENITADGEKSTREYDSLDRLIREERVISQGIKSRDIKIFREFGQDNLLKTETIMDSMYSENCFKNIYEYEFYEGNQFA